VKIDGTTVLTGSVQPGSTWIRGNIYSEDSSTTTPIHSNGTIIATSRPKARVNSTSFYYTIAPPTYKEYKISNVINVKDVTYYKVAGDGQTDDTASLQAIVNAAAGKNVLFFPHGTYILTDTLLIPPGSRLIGEAWSTLSAYGSKFKDPKNLKAMIKIGNPGDVGVAQLTDFLFTTSDFLPGAVLVGINMAGDMPGNVGGFNCHFMITGGSTTSCKTPAACTTARLCAHFTASSSAYWENSWATGQSGGSATPGAAGGFLIEAVNGTWILGLGTGEFDIQPHSMQNSHIPIC